jgi:hypothetical protein
MNRFTAALAACASLALLPGVTHAQNITSCAQGQVCMSIDGSTGGGARVPLNTTPGRAAIAINPADGSVTVRSLNEGVQQCTQVSTTPAITSFTATPGSVTPGSQVTLSWTTVNVPTTGTPCQAVGGPSEWTANGMLPSTGSRVIQANGVAPSTLTYSLRCTGVDSTQVTQTTSVALTSGGGGGCTGQNAPPAGYSLQTLSLCSVYQCSLGPFPPTGNTRFVQLSNRQSLAMQFTATLNPGAPAQGAVSTDEWINVSNPDAKGAGPFTISQCPHDFFPTSPNCKSGPAEVNIVGYQVGGSSGDRCSLTPGGVYYANITSGDSATPGQPLGHCGQYPCTVLTVWRGNEVPR